MNTNWQDYLVTRGARFDNDNVSSFGNPADELRSAAQATIVVPLTHLGLISCAGDDAKTFLQNQLTSDVNHLANDGVQHSSWCSHKGRMQASFLFYRKDDEYRGLISADLLDATLPQLQRYVLRAKAKLSNLSEAHVAIGIAGPAAADALRAAGLSLPGSSMSSSEFAAGTVISLTPYRFIVVAEIVAATELFEKLSVTVQLAGVPTWLWHDIQAGIVLVTAAIKEEFVPQMVNFDQIGGVSFHKGCFPGQEVVARARYLGKIKRHLYRIKTTGAVNAGDSLFEAGSHDQVSGVVASVAPAPDGGFVALAVIKESAIASDEIHLEIPGVIVTGLEAVVVSEI